MFISCSPSHSQMVCNALVPSPLPLTLVHAHASRTMCWSSNGPASMITAKQRGRVKLGTIQAWMLMHVLQIAFETNWYGQLTNFIRPGIGHSIHTQLGEFECSCKGVNLSTSSLLPHLHLFFFFFFFEPIYIPAYMSVTKPGHSYELLHLNTTCKRKVASR